MMDDDYQFEDADVTIAKKSAAGEDNPGEGQSFAKPAHHGRGHGQGSGHAGGHGNDHGDSRYADEIFSKKIQAKFRTFYVDLKESTNGKFIKISEKSHGRKSTIMMDAEDVPEMIAALKEVSEKL